jgi:uncharacterized protein DUF6776
MSKLVVKKHRPFEIVLAAVVFSSIISVIVWLLLDVNHWNVIKSRLSLSQETRLLWEVNQGLETENKQLKERVVMLERSTQIDNLAADKLQNEILTLQDETYLLKGELEFYQGIMAATTDSKGLNVQGLHIEATGQERLYHFKLVLTNVAKSDRVVEVIMDMSVEGMNEAGSKVLSLDEVIAGSELKREIKFKNFERIEGSLNFPKGFKPLRVVVDLQQKGLRTTVQKIFEWPAIAG